MKRKILTYFSFALASVIIVTAFVTSTTYTQLIVASLLYPPVVCFAFIAFPRKAKRSPAKKTVEKVIYTPVSGNMMGIADIDKRVFLKLIGGVGLTLFLFSIFNKKSEAMFFKNATGAVTGTVALEDGNGKKIDPARNQPMDGFTISEVDDDAITFYGFTNQDGNWYVMREDTETGSFRYSKGDSNFPLNWSNRKKLQYGYFNDSF